MHSTLPNVAHYHVSNKLQASFHIIENKMKSSTHLMFFPNQLTLELNCTPFRNNAMDYVFTNLAGGTLVTCRENKGTLGAPLFPKFIPMGITSSQLRKHGIVANVSRFQMKIESR